MDYKLMEKAVMRGYGKLTLIILAVYGVVVGVGYAVFRWMNQRNQEEE